MNPEWLCYVNGQEYGPYTWPQLVQMAASGNIVPQSHVRRNFDSQWYLAEQVPGLFAPAAGPKQAPHPAAPARAVSASNTATKKVAKSGAHPAVSAAVVAPAAVAVAHPAPPAPQPIVQPAQPAVPKGRVVSPKPAAAAGDTVPQWIPVSPTAVAPASPSVGLKTQPDAGEVAAPVKKDNSKTMVLALGGAICAVAILGGAAVIWKMTRQPEEPKEVAAAPVVISTTESDPTTVADEANPAGETNPAGTAEATKPAIKPTTTPTKQETKKPGSAPAAASVTNAVVNSVATWKPIERFGTVGTKKGLTCTKLTAYLAADAAGRKVTVRAQEVAAKPAGEAAPDNGTAASVAPNPETNATETPPIIAPMPAAAPAGPTKFVSAEAAPFLFVELTIKNSDTKPLVYSGWNNAETAAVLVDGAGKTLELVAPNATPNVTRPIAKEIPPGGTMQDTLVFAIPAAGDLTFKLALPGKAFSSKVSATWGYDISGAALAAPAAGAQIGGDPANPQAAPLVPRSSTTIPIPGLQDPAPPQPAPAPIPEKPAPEKPADMPEPEKKPPSSGPIPIPGLTDAPADNKPAAPKRAEEVPNLGAPPAKKN